MNIAIRDGVSNETVTVEIMHAPSNWLLDQLNANANGNQYIAAVTVHVHPPALARRLDAVFIQSRPCGSTREALDALLEATYEMLRIVYDAHSLYLGDQPGVVPLVGSAGVFLNETSAEAEPEAALEGLGGVCEDLVELERCSDDCKDVRLSGENGEILSG